MNRDQQAIRGGAEVAAPSTYEAPSVETVLTPEDLEREVEYAGTAGSRPD